MTQDKIIEITKQVGGFSPTPEFLEAFAKQVEEHCCSVIRDNIPRSGHDTKEYVFAFKLIDAIKKG